METLTKTRAICGPNREPLSPAFCRAWFCRALFCRTWFCRARFCGVRAQSLWLLLLAGTLAGTMTLSSCGGGSSNGSVVYNATLSGNWQFTMAPPADGSFLGGLQGGFLLQSNGSATGAANYAVSLPQLPYPCNTGSAAITGTLTQNVWTLTAVAGTQTFVLTGTLNFDGSTIVGTYTSTAGTSGNGAPCGTLQTAPMQWSAVLVPPITGTIQGSFHSTGGAAGLSNQDFAVSGSLTQAANTGASNATVTGTLNFTEPETNQSDYPCFDTASVYGQISGSSVTLQIVGPNQSIIGLIGEPVGSNGVIGINPVTFVAAQGGYILNGVGPSYLVATNACPGSLGSTGTAGDYGNMCLAVGSTLGTRNACQEPITLTPAAVSLTYPPPVGDTTSTQTVTLANSSLGSLSGLTLTFANVPATPANFTETDDCGPGGLPAQGPFNLASGQSCVITITFNPQCGSQCGSPLTATLTVTSPVSADGDTIFTVPITGTVTNGDAVATRAISFGAEGASNISQAQLLSFANSFANRSGHPVQILRSTSNRSFQDVEHDAEIY